MTLFNQHLAFRRRVLAWMAAAPIASITSLHSPGAMAQSRTTTLRIGYQKYGTLTILKARATLESRLAASGVQVKWAEFPSGPVLLEALNVGSIDFGTVGEAPPIFAQAAGANLVYVAHEPPAPRSEAILVPSRSTLLSVADLKGKKVALNKGSNVHYLLVKSLEKASLRYQDVDVIFLPPSDARAAFERGSVDAWVIWDPFFAAAEKQLGARILADGTGVVSNHQFFLASRQYAEHHGAVLDVVFDELVKTSEWSRNNLDTVASILSDQVGLPVDIVAKAAQRYSYGVQPVRNDVLAQQQKIADTFAKLKLIPKTIDVRQATLLAKI